jgi:prepilin-type N-terminal cleavage/methylation domain-containing protein
MPQSRALLLALSRHWAVREFLLAGAFKIPGMVPMGFDVYWLGPPSERTAAGGMCARFQDAWRCGRPRAFTLIEVMLSMVIISVLFIGIYGAITSSVSIVRICQDNERVTQILSEKMDMIRVYNWQQLTNRFIPTNFIERLDSLDTNSVYYFTGSIAIVQAPISENYRTNLMQVTVDVKWLSGKRPQSRNMTTYVAKYGLQSYILE